MAKTATKNAVAVRKTAPPPARREDEVEVPAFMRDKAGAGTEKIDTADIEMPRIKLVQAVDADLLAAHEGLRAGEFFHTLAEVPLGNELDFVPLYISKRVVLWRPRPPIDMGGILARADDAVHWQPADKEFEVKIDKRGTKTKWKTARTVAESGLLEWGSYDPQDPDSQPAATLCHVIVVALPEYPEYSPVALFLQRSAIKPGRKLLGKINIIGGRSPIYGQIYRMSSFDDQGASGPFKNYAFQANGFVQDEDDFKRYEGLHEVFMKKGVIIKDEEAAQEEDHGTATVDEAPKDRRTGKSKY